MAKKQNAFRDRKARSNERRKAESGFSYLNLPDGIDLFKPEKDWVTFDILPYIITSERHLDRDDAHKDAQPGDEWDTAVFKTHRNVGPDNKTVICPTTFGKKCPICEEFNRLNAEDAEWDDIKEIKAKDRNLFVINPIDTSGYKEDYDDKPYVYDTSYKMFTEMLEEAFDTQDVDYLALKEGHSVKAKFKEKKFGKNKFYECVDVTFKERDYDHEEDVRKAIPSLDDLFIVYSYEQLKSMYFDMGEPDDVVVEEDEQEPEEKEEKTTRTTRTTRKPKENAPKKETEEPAEEPAEEKKTTRTRSSTKKETDGPKCPKGHKYGVDTDEDACKADCDDCNIWDACLDAKDEKNA